MSPNSDLSEEEIYVMHLRESLALARAPRGVLDEVVLRDQRKVHPPQPGWDRPPGRGLIRIWTDRDLLRWYDLGADQDLFGPLDRVTFEALSQAMRAARHSGEGAQVIVGVDVLRPSDWVGRGHKHSLWPDDFMCIGPRLSTATFAAIQTPLTEAGLGHAVVDRESINRVTTFNGVACFETTWMSGLGESGGFISLTE